MSMKTTGIIRRIDDLGRVVIPKEIRRNLCIREGDPLELFMDDGMVAFKPYLPVLDAELDSLKDRIIENSDCGKRERLQELFKEIQEIYKS